MNQLITELRDSDQDFEFYPTTNEIIKSLEHDVRKLRASDDFVFRSSADGLSILDIGAGSGKVLAALRETTYPRYGQVNVQYPIFGSCYAIEKSPILCDRLPKNVFIIGTDFNEQSLVSKSIDVTFCNPPYSVFEDWAVRIIRESSSFLVYLVIPVRWKDSVRIADALKFRDADATVVGEFTFENSEDRKARAVVNLIRIELPNCRDDAFNRFFNEQFASLRAKFKASKESTSSTDKNSSKKDRFANLVVGPSYPDRLVGLYNNEIDQVQKNYQLVSQLDAELLKEFDISPDRILGCLKERLAGLKGIYWHQLFENMTQVTDRLVEKKRRLLLDTLNRNGHVDFTVSNIHAIIIWVLKNANAYIEEQLIETFESMISKANVRSYKSNLKPFVENKWRYNQERPTHIALDYRLVLERSDGLNRNYSGRDELCESAAGFIKDILTVANTLGFICDTNDDRLAYDGRKHKWSSGVPHVFTYKHTYEIGESAYWSASCKKKIKDRVQLPDGGYQYEVDGEWYHEKSMPGEPLIEVRAFLNGNMHVRLAQKFALSLNVEYGRLKGWLRSGAHAAEELGDEDAAQYFDTQLKLGPRSLPMIAAPAEPTPTLPFTAAQPVQTELGLAV